VLRRGQLGYGKYWGQLNLERLTIMGNRNGLNRPAILVLVGEFDFGQAATKKDWLGLLCMSMFGVLSYPAPC
jgi:hypothetical protein